MTQTHPAFTLDATLLTRGETFSVLWIIPETRPLPLFLFTSISFSLLNVSHISQDLWIQITSHKGLYWMFLFLFWQRITYCSICSHRALGTWSIFFLLYSVGLLYVIISEHCCHVFHKDFDSYILLNYKYSVITLIVYEMTTTFFHLEAFRFCLKCLLFLKYFSSNLEKKTILIITIISLSLHISSTNNIPVHIVIPWLYAVLPTLHYNRIVEHII